jgi:ABC-type multidrug transport system fused ATPase/permease subunit
MIALYRMVELTSGSISLDGVDISQIGLHTLRDRIASTYHD